MVSFSKFSKDGKAYIVCPLKIIVNTLR